MEKPGISAKPIDTKFPHLAVAAFPALGWREAVGAPILPIAEAKIPDPFARATLGGNALCILQPASQGQGTLSLGINETFHLSVTFITPINRS